MKKLNYSLAALALIALAACNKAEMPGFLSDPDAVRIEAAVGALTKSNPLGTTEEQKTFNEGDRIAVTNAGKTVVYKLQSGTWAPENPGEYLKWDKNNLAFDVKYPADYTTLPADQSTIKNLAAADNMYTKKTYTNGIPDDRILSANLVRKNVLVKIKIAGYLDQYKEGETYIKNLSFNKVQFPLIQDEKGNYVEGSYTMGTVDCTYIAILEPNSGAADASFVEMILHKANQEEGPLKVKGIPELVAGHAYTFKLFVGKETVKVGSVTVNEWTTGATLPYGETDPVDTWDGQTVSAFATHDANGSELGNSETSPILINNCAQLAYLAQQVNGGTDYYGKFFKLTDDLNLAGKEWTEIGRGNNDPSSVKPFSGTFDGAGHEIMGLKVDANRNYLGLFGYIKGATVKDLKITSADISSSSGDYGAILCGYAEEANISNCSVSGKVRIEDTTAGGIVAELRNTDMKNCTAEVNVTSRQYVGGLCGKIDYGIIEKCTVLPGSTMDVISNAYTPIVGGLIGCISNKGNYESQIAYCNTYAKVSGFGNVGGAIGYVDADGSHQIGECTVYGDVSVVALPSGKQNFGIGGFVGTLYNTGGTPSFSKCGFNGTIANADGTSLTKGSIYGAFIGLDESKATFTECWYNADKTGELEAIGDNKTKTGIEAKNLGK